MEEHYRVALQHHVARRGAPARTLPGAVARRAVDSQVGVLDLVQAHRRSLQWVMAQDPDADHGPTVDAAAGFLAEVLTAYALSLGPTASSPAPAGQPSGPRRRSRRSGPGA